MRICIHPLPTVRDFDLHLPYVAGPFQNINKEVRHGPEVWVQNLLSVLGSETSISLCNNGEPYSRLDMTRRALEKYAPHLSVTMHRSDNPGRYKQPDPVFCDRRAFRVLPDMIDRHLVHQAVNFYLDHWQKFAQTSIRALDRDHGFFPYNNMLWYNFGYLMPHTSNHYNQRMDHLLDQIWTVVADACASILSKFGLPACDVRHGLNLRVVHNRPGQAKDDGYEFFKHIDGTLITGWLYENIQAANIGIWTTDKQMEQDTAMIPVKNLHDQNSGDLLIIPGSAWCDHCDTDTSATWHEVKIPDPTLEDRASLVFLLRAPNFEKTIYQFDKNSV